ncbi:hypothetical protein [Pseudomonas phage vB_Pa-PAC4]
MTFYFFGHGSEARPLEPKRRTPHACLGNPLQHTPGLTDSRGRDPRPWLMYNLTLYSRQGCPWA